MPTTYYWVATTSPASLNTLTNYNTARDGSGSAPGALPTTGDTIIFEGSGTVQPDADLAVLTDVLALVDWSASYPMGTSGTPIGLTATTVRVRNTTFVNLQALGSSGIRYLDIDLASNATVSLSVASTGGFSGDGSNAGYVNLNCNASVSGEVCSVAGSIFRVFGGTCTMNYSSSACQKVEVEQGGTLFFERSVGTLAISYGGKATGKNNAPISTGLYVEPRGEYTHESYGTIALCDVKPGGKAGAASNKYRFSLTSRIRRKGADNFTDTSKITNTPNDTGVGSVSVI